MIASRQREAANFALERAGGNAHESSSAVVLRGRIGRRVRLHAHVVSVRAGFSADEGKTWEVNWVATDTRGPEKKAR
jgi:hypothetical protein